MNSIKAAPRIPLVAHRGRANHRATASVPQSGRAGTLFAASLSIGAAAIHLAAASTHLEPLGDLALGFYWAALFQAAFALALLAHPSSRRLSRVGVGINLTLIAAWAWSRTIGLPTIPGGAEPVGIADATTVAFQVLLVSMLVTRLAGRGTGPVRGRSTARLDAVASSAFAVGIGLVVLSTTIAMNDGLTGHGHADGAAHAHPNDAPALTAPGPIETPHDHGGTTPH